MNKTIICLILLVTAVNVYGQKERTRIALRAGVHVPLIDYVNLPADFSKPDVQASVYGGFQVNLPVGEKLSIAPEAVLCFYEAQSYSTSLRSIQHDGILQALVPVLFRYRLGKVSVFAGPQAQFLLSAKGSWLKETPDDPDYSHYLEQGANITSKSYSVFGISGVIGAEWVFKYRFGIDARYQLGFSDFRGKNPEGVLTKSSEKIRADAFQAGLFFRFGKKPRKAN